MNYDKLDNEELLRLALEAINQSQDADSVVMLKTLLEREPGHVFGQYLLAAQHAQLSMFDRAETGFRSVVAVAPDFLIARFQLAQLLMLQGGSPEVRQLLAPVASETNALAAYARALLAVADENLAGAVSELDAGLALPQDIPALAGDMRRLREQFLTTTSDLQTLAPTAPPVVANSMFLGNYAREN